MLNINLKSKLIKSPKIITTKNPMNKNIIKIINDKTF